MREQTIQGSASGLCRKRWLERPGGQGSILRAGERGLGEREQGAVSESEELSAEMWLLWGLGRSGERGPWSQVVDQSAALGTSAGDTEA